MTTTRGPLDGRTVGIVAMTTWGEAGNWLSARALAATIARSAPSATVHVQVAEELMPLFGDAGASIKAATLGSGGPRERHDRYAAVLDALGARLPRGFEERPEAWAAELRPLAAWIEATAPDLLIGTKGVICRTLVAAARLADVRVPVVNYVTNHAHFAFDVHRCPGAVRHVVRRPEAERFLVGRCGVDADAVDVVGYLVAAQQLDEAPTVADSSTPAVIVVSNRGGDEYLDLLRSLAGVTPLDLTFVALNDERLRQAAAEVADEVGAQSWQLFTALRQQELFNLMRRARGSPVCALVCKASPNSIFEAAYFRLPMFLLRTGLPMEEWGADLVEEEGLGIVAEEMDALATALTTCLRDPGRIGAMRQRLDAFADRELDQEQTIGRLLGSLHDVVAAHAAPTP